MKKATALSLLLLLALTTPVFATPGNNNGKSQEHKKQPSQQVLADEVTPTLTVTPSVTLTPTLTPTTTPTQEVLGACDANAQWKNHGQYVSCVAKQHLGGQVTSAAARSDVGKKKHSMTPTPTLTITPTITVTPTATPTATVTPSASPTPITGSADSLSLSLNPLESVKELFANISRFFKDLV